MNSDRSQLLLLARNELRLYLRGGFLQMSNMAFLLLGQMLLHAIALGVALIMMGKPPAAAQSQQYLLAAGLVAMLFLMTSRALAGAVQSLYTRGDLDLLLASPVDRRAIIGVRMGSLALAVAGEVAYLVWPFANLFVLFGHFAWLKAYVVVPSMAMVATSIGLGVALFSFRTFGPRRTRVGMQVLAALVGTGIMFAMFLPQMLRPGAVAGNLPAGAAALASHSGSFGELIVAPARMLMRGAVPTLEFLLASAALLALTVHVAGEPIVRTLTGISADGGRRVRRTGADAVRFRGNFRVVVVLKELKLIARDPFLITQILRQSLMVLPMGFVLWRAHLGGLPLAWLSTIWLAAGLAGPLSWLTVLAEDAPDLLAAAPVSRAALIRAKLEAAMLPVLPVCAAPLVFLLFAHPWFAVCTSSCAFGAALTLAVLNMRNPTTVRRDSFGTRHQAQGSNGLLEMVAMAFWLLLCLGLAWLGTLIGWR